jgi:hypothetical protein
MFSPSDATLELAGQIANVVTQELDIGTQAGRASEDLVYRLSHLPFPDPRDVDVYADGGPPRLADIAPDVAANLEQFAADLNLLRTYYPGMALCVKLSNSVIVPVSLDAVLAAPLSSSYSTRTAELKKSRTLIDEILSGIQSKPETPDNRLVIRDPQTALDGFRGEFSNFLSYRLAGLRFKWSRLTTRAAYLRGAIGLGPKLREPRPDLEPNESLEVQVVCRTQGLRIHWSPAYFIKWTVFGSPTTPVVGHLRPGRYVFAGDGSPLTDVTQDDGVFSIPPTYCAALTRF